MIVRTLKSYIDKETKKVYRTSDKKKTREVSEERGAELIAKGVVEEVLDTKKSK